MRVLATIGSRKVEGTSRTASTAQTNARRAVGFLEHTVIAALACERALQPAAGKLSSFSGATICSAAAPDSPSSSRTPSTAKVTQGKSNRHRFQYHVGHSFVVCRQEQQFGPSHPFERRGLPTDKVQAIAMSELRLLSAQLRVERPASHDDEMMFG